MLKNYGDSWQRWWLQRNISAHKIILRTGFRTLSVVIQISVIIIYVSAPQRHGAVPLWAMPKSKIFLNCYSSLFSAVFSNAWCGHLTSDEIRVTQYTPQASLSVLHVSMWGYRTRILKKYGAGHRYRFRHLLFLCGRFPKWHGGDHTKQLWEKSHSVLCCISWRR